MGILLACCLAVMAGCAPAAQTPQPPERLRAAPQSALDALWLTQAVEDNAAGAQVISITDVALTALLVERLPSADVAIVAFSPGEARFWLHIGRGRVRCYASAGLSAANGALQLTLRGVAVNERTLPSCVVWLLERMVNAALDDALVWVNATDATLGEGSVRLTYVLP